MIGSGELVSDAVATYTCVSKEAQKVCSWPAGTVEPFFLLSLKNLVMNLFKLT